MQLTLEALFGPTPLAGPVASQVKLSPNGKTASTLRAAANDRERLELWLMDLATGRVRRMAHPESAPPPTAMSVEERAERERRRLFHSGITAYAWHPDSERILFTADGGAHLVAIADRASQALTPPGTRQTGIRLSPKGSYVSYVRAGDLHVRAMDGAEQRLTRDGGGTVSNGLPEFIAQEEMHRFHGHWWSPDEQTIAFARVDTAPVAETYRHEINAGGIDVVAQRYPFAGAANAEVRLGIVDIGAGETTWLDWALAADDYLADVQFAPDGALVVQAQSRDQRRLAVRRFRHGRWRDVLTETSATWINLHDNLTFAGPRLLWTSERTGAAQLFAYDEDGAGQAVATGLGRVNDVLAASPTHAWLTGWRDDPTCQDVFEVSLASGECRALSAGDAWHDGVVNADAGVALITRTAPDALASVRAVDLQTRRPGRLVAGGALNASQPYFAYLDAHAASTLGHIHCHGETLHYRLTRPAPFDPSERYPVIVHVYGGPGVQRVRRDFPPLSLQIFAQAGFAVFELDNRGGSNRHKAFEDAIHGTLGRVEVRDQFAGVDHLRSLPWVDDERIGLFGHSYGGYMTLKCLSADSTACPAFAAGVSVAPVTRWELYDTHYTERYLGTPSDNAAGFAASSVLPDVGNIRVPLLLMHGMADDNVLFTHSTELMRALQEAGVAFELMTYPGSKHALQEPRVAIHRYRHILAFFKRALRPA